MAEPSTTYEPRCPAQTALYQIVRDHFETFRVQAARLRNGEGLPRFVEQEFRNFLRCGSLAGGFARFRCDDCSLDRLVPFSCKARAICPSCGGRRMAERAAHLLDHGVADGRGGAVAVIQRFGGALNLNLHVHALVLDGVFAKDGSGVVGFHSVPCLTALDVAEVLATVEPRITRLLDRRGLGEGDDQGSGSDAWADDAPALAGLAAASVQGIVALGPSRGARLRRLGHASESVEAPAPDGCHARANGFDLHAAASASVDRRDDARGVRPGRVPWTDGGARAATAHQFDSVPRRAGPPGGVAG